MLLLLSWFESIDVDDDEEDAAACAAEAEEEVVSIFLEDEFERDLDQCRFRWRG